MAIARLGTALAAISLLASVEAASANTSDANSWRANGCNIRDIYDVTQATPSLDEAFRAAGAIEAWSDVVRNWTDTDKGKGLTFTQSIAQTLDIRFDPSSRATPCTNFSIVGECTQQIGCQVIDPNGGYVPGANPGASTVAGFFLWNSLAEIASMQSGFFDLINDGTLNSSRAYLDAYWAGGPPKSDVWPAFLDDVITAGHVIAYGAYVKSYLDTTLYWVKRTPNNNTRDIHDELFNFVKVNQLGQIFTKNKSDPDRTPQKGTDFEAYIKLNTYAAWKNASISTVEALFRGDDLSIEAIEALITDGQLIGGEVRGGPMNSGTFRHMFEKILITLGVSFAWRQPGASAFVMDTGISCSDDPASQMGAYLSNDTMSTTGACYKGKQYYLVQPQGSSKKGVFSAPNGIDWMDSNTELSEGLNRRDFIIGTYATNGNMSSPSISLSDDNMRKLAESDFLSSGLIHLPVCSPSQALDTWRSSSAEKNANFPCPA